MNGADFLDVRSRLRRTAATPRRRRTAYTVFHDPPPTASIDARRRGGCVRQNLLRTLPAAEPTAAPASVASSAPRRRTTPITRGLFGIASILG